MNFLSILGFIVLAFIALPLVLKLVFGLLGITLGLLGLAIKLAIYGGLAYLIYSGFKAVTA